MEWKDLLIYGLLAGGMFMMMRFGGCCGGHGHDHPKEHTKTHGKDQGKNTPEKADEEKKDPDSGSYREKCCH